MVFIDYRDRVSWSWDDKSGSRELEFQIKVHIVTYLLPPLPMNAVRGPSRCLVAPRPELSTPHVEAECRLCRAVTEIIVGCQPAHLFSCFTHHLAPAPHNAAWPPPPAARAENISNMSRYHGQGRQAAYNNIDV